MRNKWSVLFLVGIFLFTMTSPSLAATVHKGQPSVLDQANSVGYYIWQDGNRWHLRTVNAGTQRLFTGVIETDGKFSDVSILPSEKVERVALSVRTEKIEFHFNSTAKMDGLSFTVNGGQNATFTLFLDGLPVPAGNVYVGSGNLHPGANAFTVKLNDDSSAPVVSTDYQGQPTALNPGNVFGYFIWQAQNRWYLQTTTTGAERLFTGSIETDGTLSDVTALKSLRPDGAVVNASGSKINFSFKTGGSGTGVSITFGEGLKLNQPDKLSGLSFLASDAATLSINLFVDGQAIDPASIYLGSTNQHPAGNALKIISRNK